MDIGTTCTVRSPRDLGRTFLDPFSCSFAALFNTPGERFRALSSLPVHHRPCKHARTLPSLYRVDKHPAGRRRREDPGTCTLRSSMEYTRSGR
jgi:hypothetical protein